MQDSREKQPSSPVFGSFASAFGFALGELVLLAGNEDDILYVLRKAWIEAWATVQSRR